MSTLIRACIAVAAFAAFAVLPATASAAEATITAPTGTVLTPSHGSPVAINATNVGHTVMTDAEGGILTECTTATMSGNLETNTHSAIEGTINAAEFRGKTGVVNHGTHCKGSAGDTLVTAHPAGGNGLPWCLRSTAVMKEDELQVRGGSCTQEARPITFQLDVTTFFGTVQCNYERSEAISGTYKTHPEEAVLSINKVRFVRHNSGFPCPAEGFLDMSFRLRREGHAAYIDKAIT